MSDCQLGLDVFRFKLPVP